MALKKDRFLLSELDVLVNDEKSCIKRRDKCHRRLWLSPIHLSDIKGSVKECLDSEVTTYDEGLNGIILSFKNVKVNTVAEDHPGNCMIPVNYIADVFIFKPKVGSVLTGVVSKKGFDHIGCLVHKTFNISIPRPSDIVFKDWSGSSLNIGDEVSFEIQYVDLSFQLPYIKGLLEI